MNESTLLIELQKMIQQEMKGLRKEIKEDIGELRKEFKSDIGELRTELKADIENSKEEIIKALEETEDGIRHYTNARFDSIEKRITRTEMDIYYFKKGVKSKKYL